MHDLNNVQLIKENFLRSSIETQLALLNFFLRSALEKEYSDLSYSSVVQYKDNTLHVIDILFNLRKLNVELLNISPELSVEYNLLIDRMELLINSLSKVNSELLVIEDYLKRNKKIHYPLFQIYKILTTLSQYGEQEYARELYERLRGNLTSKQQKTYILAAEEFNWDLFELDYILTGTITGEYGSISELSNIQLQGYMDIIESYFIGVNLRTTVRLNNILRIIIRKKLDFLNKYVDENSEDKFVDSELNELLEIYRNLAESTQESEMYLEKRDLVEKGILDLRSYIEEGKISSLLYQKFRDLKLSIEKVIELEDIDWLNSIKESLIKDLILIKLIYETENIITKWRRQRLTYLNNLIDTLNEI